MRSSFIYNFLKYAVNISYYLLMIFTCIFLVVSLTNIFGDNQVKSGAFQNTPFTYETVDFDQRLQPVTKISADGLIGYQKLKDDYKVAVKPNSYLGYYSVVSRLLFMIIGIAILYHFKKIFRQANLKDPFHAPIVMRFKILGALFILSDVLNLIHYFLFNHFLSESVHSPSLKLISQFGNGIFTGLIIWIIAVVYETGTALKEENALIV